MKKAICDVSLALFGGIFLIFLKGYEFNPVLFILLILLSIVIFFRSLEKSKLDKKNNDDLNEKILKIETSIDESSHKIYNEVSNIIDTLSKDIHHLESTNTSVLSDISKNIKEMSELNQKKNNALAEKIFEVTTIMVKSNDKIYIGVSDVFETVKKDIKDIFSDFQGEYQEVSKNIKEFNAKLHDTLSEDIHHLENTSSSFLSDINSAVSINIKEMNELIKKLEESNKKIERSIISNIENMTEKMPRIIEESIAEMSMTNNDFIDDLSEVQKKIAKSFEKVGESNELLHNNMQSIIDSIGNLTNGILELESTDKKVIDMLKNIDD